MPTRTESDDGRVKFAAEVETIAHLVCPDGLLPLSTV